MAGEIVFIHLGPAPVEYAPHYIKHARQFSPASRILFITSASHALFRYPWADHGIESVAAEDLPVTDAHRSFVARNKLDESFRDGFWRWSFERYFVLESAFRQLGLRSSFHTEYDNLLFFDANGMAARLATCYRGIAATFDSHRRAVSGVIYINNPDTLAKLTAYFERRLGSHDGTDVLTDMSIMSEFRRTQGRDVIDALPILTPDYPRPLRHGAGMKLADREPYTKGFDVIQSVFDAAAIGQYLYGIDPRNTPATDTRGFINEEAVFDPSAYDYTFQSDANGRLRPMIHSASGSWPLNNIHVHSKQPPRLSPGAAGIAVGRDLAPAAARPVAKRRLSGLGREALRRIAVSPRQHDREINRLRQQICGLQQQLEASKQERPTFHARELAAFRAGSGRRSIAPNAASNLQIDVVVTVSEADMAVLPYAVEGIRRNLRHPILRVYLIGPASGDFRHLAARLNCVAVDENSLLPVRRQDIDYRFEGVDRSGWLFQQLLKLTADDIVQAPHYLIVDADIIFLRPQVFELDGCPVLLHSDEHHEPYYQVCERLLGWSSPSRLSCVAHTILIDRGRLAALKKYIERRFGVPWYEAILSQADYSELSGFSEFELYGQWCLKQHRLDTVREYYFGMNLPGSALGPVEELECRHGSSWRLAAFHSYMR